MTMTRMVMDGLIEGQDYFWRPRGTNSVRIRFTFLEMALKKIGRKTADSTPGRADGRKELVLRMHPYGENESVWMPVKDVEIYEERDE